MCRNCPLENESARPAYNIREAERVGQVARIVPRIYAVLEDRQVDHHSTVVEVVGKIVEQSISILIDPHSTHSYITPRVVEICAFKKVKHRKSWLVQLATGTKRKVSEVVEKCPLVMNGLVTYVDLNVLPLGSYDVLIGMDWLEAHRVKLDCYNKTFECMNEREPISCERYSKGDLSTEGFSNAVKEVLQERFPVVCSSYFGDIRR